MLYFGNSLVWQSIFLSWLPPPAGRGHAAALAAGCLISKVAADYRAGRDSEWMNQIRLKNKQ